MADTETFEEDRKLFVGGLPQEATQDELKVRSKIKAKMLQSK